MTPIHSPEHPANLTTLFAAVKDKFAVGEFNLQKSVAHIRGAYGLLGREVIHALKLLQHAPGKTVIFVGVLEKVTDEFNAVTWQPQMEGSKIGRELPGVVDQVMTMHFFDHAEDGTFSFNEKSAHRRLVCRAGNPWGLPAKDRSGRLDLTEPPDLAALFRKTDASAQVAA